MAHHFEEPVRLLAQFAAEVPMMGPTVPDVVEAACDGPLMKWSCELRRNCVGCHEAMDVL